MPKLRNYKIIRHLVEGVCAGAPVGKEQRQSDGFHDATKGANGNGIERALLSNDLGDDL